MNLLAPFGRVDNNLQYRARRFLLRQDNWNLTRRPYWDLANKPFLADLYKDHLRRNQSQPDNLKIYYHHTLLPNALRP